MVDLTYIQSVFEALPIPLIIVNENHTIRFINRAGKALFKIPDETSLIGSPLAILPGANQLDRDENWLQRIESINQFAISKIEFSPFDSQQWMEKVGEKRFEFKATPILDSPQERQGFVIHVTDVTEELSAKENLAIVRSELIHPLSMMRGFLELLTHDLDLNNLSEEQQKYLSIILKHSNRLWDIVLSLKP